MNTNHLLCRAKRIDNGEWVVGYHVPFFYDCEYGVSESQDTIYSIEDHFPYEVIPSTRQKCTGWRDKNRRLVFGGMYFYSGGEYYIVDWNHEICSFECGLLYEELYDDYDESFSMDEFNFNEIETFDNIRIKEDGTAELYND